MSKKMNRTLLPLLALLGGLLLLALGPGAGRAMAADSAWRARYWNNRTLSGDPVVTRDESEINHDWGGGQPHALIGDDNFSARWTRTVDFSAGNYRFTATMDDGMRIWIDDQLLIDSWVDSQVRTLTADRVLSGGEHRIRVEYYEAGGVAVAKFGWQQIGTAPAGVFNAWKGEYFNNMSLVGQPSFLRDDRDINFDWSVGAPAPGIATDQFSVRWTRTLNFAPGTYRFDVFSDDGVRLWVNNQLVIDQWRHQSDGRFSANVALSGATSLRVEYFEDQGRAAVSLSWNPPGGNPIGGGTGGSIGTGPWLGEYYNNMNFIGAPTFTRNDAVIDFNWGEGSPGAGIPVDHFAVRWTRSVPLSAGNYRFDVFSDDGIRVWVNNVLIIDQWRSQPAGNFSATISLPSGNIPIRVEYFENTGRAAVALSSTPPLPGTGTITPPIGGLTATVTGTGGARLNIRSAPAGPLTGQQLQPNQTVGLTGFRSADSAWVQIFMPTGGTGWVSARYVTTSVPVSRLAVR
jgi:hypothetical protein